MRSCGGFECTATEGLRLYPTGFRCPLHTPAREAGRHEPGSPAMVYGWPAADGRWTRCPGCRRDPATGHAGGCSLGPRARFSIGLDGRVVGTARRGPEPI